MKQFVEGVIPRLEIEDELLDLSTYTNLVMSTVSKTLNMHFSSSFQDLISAVSHSDWNVLEGKRGSESLQLQDHQHHLK